jgi:hypothetical protein
VIWFALFLLLFAFFRAVLPVRRVVRTEAVEVPDTVAEFLRYPVPLQVLNVEVVAGGGPSDVLNHAAALMRCEDVVLPGDL